MWLARSKTSFFSVFATSFFFLAAAFAGDPLPTDVTILTQNDFVGRNFFSVADALEGVPSLNIEREGARGTRARAKMRGISQSNKVLILLDGRPLNPDYEGDVDLSQIPINIAERIEITRGGSSFSYSGEAAAGVIHIITSRPQEKGFSARLGTGVGRNGVKHHHGRFLGQSFLGHLTYLTSQEFSGGYLENEGSENNSHFLNLTRSFKGDGFIGGEYFFQESQVGLSSGTPVEFDQWNTELEKAPVNRDAVRQQEFQQAKVLFGSPALKQGHLYANFIQSWRTFEDMATLSGPSLANLQYQTSIFDLRWKQKGLELGLERRASQRMFAASFISKLHQTSAFVIKDWSRDRWTLRPALRYDRPSEVRGELNPRLVVLWQASDQSHISSTIQRSLRAPVFEELFLSNGLARPSNINSETAWSYDLGWGYEPNAKTQFKVTGFFIRVNDLILFDTPSNTYINRGKEQTAGAEAEYTLETGEQTRYRHFSVTSNWTFQQNRRSLDDGRGLVKSPLSPDHLGFLSLSYYLPLRFIVTNEWRYQSHQFELDDQQGVKVPSYYVWNIRTRFKILEADLYFDIENVTQRVYADALIPAVLVNGVRRTALAPQPERTFWAGVSIRFQG